jgi:hypothetical protein
VTGQAHGLDLRGRAWHALRLDRQLRAKVRIARRVRHHGRTPQIKRRHRDAVVVLERRRALTRAVALTAGLARGEHTAKLRRGGELRGLELVGARPLFSLAFAFSLALAFAFALALALALAWRRVTVAG